MENVKTILSAIDGKKEFTVQMQMQMSSLMFSKSFVWNVAANEALENAGTSIILNDQLRGHIVELYNNEYPEAKNAIANFSGNLTQFFRLVIRVRFIFQYQDNVEQRYVPIDPEMLQEDPIFRNVLETAKLNFINILNYMENLESEVRLIIQMIDEELDS